MGGHLVYEINWKLQTLNIYYLLLKSENTKNYGR